MIHKSLVYLACPYSDPDPAICELRFEQVNSAAAVMMRVGLHVFSPISHCHPIAKVGALPLGWDYWESYDRAILKTCAALVVLMLPGWDKSTGVTGEIRIAKELDLPIFYVYRQCSPEWSGRLRAGLPGYAEEA
jgi:hypothetical protein